MTIEGTDELIGEAEAIFNLADSARPRTRTLGFNASGASQLSWTAEQDYFIVEVVVGTGTQIVSFVNDTYANLASNGVHTNWIALGGALGCNTTRLHQKITRGQMLYWASSGLASCTVVLEYVD